MKELDTIIIDGLDEIYGTNVDADDDALSANMMLVDFRIDGSGSMNEHERTMCECLESFKNAICNSKQADEMLIAKTVFNAMIHTGGFVAPEDFDTSYASEGRTRLYDAIIDGRQRILNYMDQLRDAGTNAQACMVILSDGKDWGSTNRISDARRAIEDMISKEIKVAFIAFGDEAFGIANKLGIKKENVKEVSNDESELRRIIDLVSKSAISAAKKANDGAGSDSAFFV